MKQVIVLVLSLFLMTAPAMAQKDKRSSSSTKKGSTKTIPAKPGTDDVPPAPISKTETEILDELNLLRSDPQNYIQYLEKLKESFSGKTFTNANGVKIVTFEGITPVTEAIEFLKTQPALDKFTISKGLSQGAAQHLGDMSKNGFFGHRGSDQSLPGDRASSFGTTKGGVTENLTEGSQTAREIVLQMLVSDGLKSRSQRNNLLNPRLKIVGIAAGEGKTGFLCVLLLAESFQEKD